MIKKHPYYLQLHTKDILQLEMICLDKLQFESEITYEKENNNH